MARRTKVQRGLLTRKPLSLRRAVNSVSGPGRGAVVTFSGIVRSLEKGKRIGSIRYEAYAGMAEPGLSALIDEAERRWRVRVSLRHRIGRVPAGQTAIVVACGGKHRREAFAAARFLIEALKRKIPIWKTAFGRRRRRG